MVTRILLAFVLLAGPTLAAVAQQPTGQAGIIYGSRHAFSIAAPEGWVLDNQSGRADRLFAVFYRTGETWADAQAGMYVNTVAPDSGRPARVETVIRDDSARFATQSPGLKITASAPIRTQDGRLAVVRHFVGDAFGNFEAVAYIPEETITPIIVLTARSRVAFERALPAFERLVRSYRFITADVRMR